MQNRKETAWKKSRKFGDVKGGRKWPKLKDKIFNRKHNFLKPVEGDVTPIFILDNETRDLFFPINQADVESFLTKLPAEHTDMLTHIWFRKLSNKEYEEDKALCCFMCGSGVNLIVFYPFRRDLIMNFGKKKPSSKVLKWYAPYSNELMNVDGEWQLKWTEESIKAYYLESLLLFQLGNQFNSFYKDFWSKANKVKSQNFANNYAYFWANYIRNDSPN